jgi:Fe-S oxidoreductase
MLLPAGKEAGLDLSYYDRERCNTCGKCLAACPVLRLDESTAAGLIERLAGGSWAGEVLDRCTGCMSCDASCPNGANPYGLLLERYSERYQGQGIPRVFCGAMPQRDGPNLWRSLEKWLSPTERSDLSTWADPRGASEVLFLGCNQRLTPYVASTALFKDLAIYSDPGQCCGEYYLRLGLLEQGAAKAESLSRKFRQLGIKRVIAFCPACQNTMQHLAPDILGVRFDVEVTGLVEWLAGELGAGRIAPAHSLDLKVTVQDPCHASGLGEEPVAQVRELLGGLGISVVEMENSGTMAECCGLGASIARYRLTDVIGTGLQRGRQAGHTGADRTCAWCNGCYMVMNMFRLLYPLQPPVYHLLELLQEACGEEPARQMPSRALQLVACAVEATARDGFRFGRTRV